ncbi:MAG: Trk system potassium transporter TrkA, partial [Acidimicrobiia bacterium]|nr:Trk system potassium transporter TrkA [Acidimicrobiia bacterium]
GHDVAVIEVDEVTARSIGEELDVQVVVGSATVPSVLKAARIDRAGLLAGVTQNDEVNLIASLLAKEAGVPQTVVRIQTDELRGDAGAALRETMRADVVIDPDLDTADEVMELAHTGGADEVYPMAGGDLVVLGAVVGASSAFVGQDLRTIGESFEPNWQFLFGALTRDGETVIPRGAQTIEAGDHVRVLATRKARREIMELLGAATRRARRVMVLGGGSVGSRVAERLTDEGAEVTLVEYDGERARDLGERLRRVSVVQGDITDTELLLEESISAMDLVIAATGDDSANVLACAYAAAQGDAFTVAVLHRLALLPLVRQFGIDAMLSPRTASANAVLRQVRGGTASVATFLESDVEVNELEIQAGSRADGMKVADLHLHHDVLLGAVIRPGEHGEIIRGRTVLKAGDNVVVFARPGSLQLARKAFEA